MPKDWPLWDTVGSCHLSRLFTATGDELASIFLTTLEPIEFDTINTILLQIV